MKINKLNLGCGNTKINGYLGVDYTKNINVDIVHDLNIYPYPWENNSIKEIILDNVLEHLNDVVKTIDELYRILQPNGKIIIRVPYAKSDWAFVDPTHKHFFTENSFNYFTETHEYNYYSKSRFTVKYKFINNTQNLSHKIRNLLPLKGILRYFLFNIFDEIEFELIKLKQQHENHKK